MSPRLCFTFMIAMAAIALPTFVNTASAYGECEGECAGAGCSSYGGHWGGGHFGGVGSICCPGYTGCACDCGYMLPAYRARWYNWNRNYAYTDYGQPVALVVPPTANLQTNYGWGVASSRLSRIEHQFQRNFPGYGAFGGPFRPTPVWPSDTTQFGVYYVRGPW
ncbi:MAG TPA: hypothetical protein VHK01_06560 [Lacipirellulaceae bacterium]|nr:hypothetical protein [Lacipirellulaceae bacterium]